MKLQDLNTMLILLCLSCLLLKGEVSAQNSTTVSVSTGNSSCTSGQVIDVVVHGGVAGERGPPGSQGPAGPPGGGVVYTHWGRTTCPNIQGTERVYEGRIVGSRWDQAGSSNYLCLHSNLELHHYIPGVQTDRAYLYDTRYQIDDIPPAFGHLHSRDIPCAVCYSSGRVQPPSLSLGEHLVLPHGQQNTLAT